MNPLRRRDLLLSLKYSTVEASFSVPMLNLTMPNLPFAIAFAVQALGAGPTFVAFMAALPHLANFAQPPLTGALRRRLPLFRMIALSFVLSALPWGFVSFLPAVSSPEARLLVFGLMIALTTAANSFGSVAWSASIAELVPPRISGRFFGRRNLIFGFWTLVTVLVAGSVVDAAGGSLTVFGAIYALAAAARLIGLFFLHQMRFPPAVMELKRTEDSPAVPGGKMPLRNPSYRSLIIYIGGWGLLVNMGLPFYTVYLLQHLDLSLGTVALLTTTGSFGALLTLKAWGQLIDHFGSKPVLGVCTVLWSLAGATSWLLADTGFTWHLYLNYLVVGAATAGFQLCQFNLMIRLAPTEARAEYISTFLSVTSLLTAAGPLLGGILLAALPVKVGNPFGIELTNYQVLFVIPLLLGLTLTRVLRGIVEPDEQSTEAVWKMMRSMKTFNPLLGMSTAVEFLFTPRGMLGLARTSIRSLRRHARNISDVGNTMLRAGKRGRRRAPSNS